MRDSYWKGPCRLAGIFFCVKQGLHADWMFLILAQGKMVN